MVTKEITALVRSWTEEVHRIRTRYRDDARARVLEVAAEELLSAITAANREMLTLEEAVAYSGYSKSHLRALIDEGRLTQAGKKGDPRFFRVELPVKAGHHRPTPHAGAPAVVRRRRRT